MPTWAPLLASFVIPGSGYVLLARPMRGLVMIFWMLIFGYITFQLTSTSISFVGRYAGGIAVWVLSILEVYSISRKRRTI